MGASKSYGRAWPFERNWLAGDCGRKKIPIPKETLEVSEKVIGQRLKVVMRKIVELAEQGFTVVSLLLYSGGPLTVILSDGASEGDKEGTITEYPLIQIAFFLIYVVTFFLLVVRWRKVLYVFSKDRWILPLVELAAVSLLWSFAPAKTLSRAVALIGTTLFGLYLATRYSMRQQVQLLGWMFGLAIGLSFILAFALPKYGIMGGTHAGAWRGIYTHKNVLGKVMIPSAIIFWILAIGGKRNRPILWGCFSLSVTLLILSTSTSCLINLMIIISAFFIFQTLRWRYDLMLPAIISITVTGVILHLWLTANADILLGSLGKDATLTGRTDLWPPVLDMIWKRLWLGYGYSGFWLGWDGESAYVWRAIGWEPPNAHSGLLDLWLDLGFLGVSIYLLGFWATLLRALVWVRASRTPEGLWPLIYLTSIVLLNLSESTLLIQNNIFWVLYVAAALSVLLAPEEPAKMVAQSGTRLQDQTII
jgi:O-antigen ligase